MSRKYIVKDNRETVELAAPFTTAADGTATLQGKFKPKHRVLELTDAQVLLFGAAINEALADGLLLVPVSRETEGSP